MKKKLRNLVPPWTDGVAHLQICLVALIGPSLISLGIFHADTRQHTTLEAGIRLFSQGQDPIHLGFF